MRDGDMGMDGRRICCEGVEGFERAEVDDRDVVEEGSAERGEGTVKSAGMLIGRILGLRQGAS